MNSALETVDTALRLVTALELCDDPDFVDIIINAVASNDILSLMDLRDMFA